METRKPAQCRRSPGIAAPASRRAMIHFSLGGVPHLGVKWSGWKTESLSSITFLNLDPASVKSVQASMTSPGMITRINLDLLYGLAGSVPNFQSIRKTTSFSASTSMRVFLGNRGRINLTHSRTKDLPNTIHPAAARTYHAVSCCFLKGLVQAGSCRLRRALVRYRCSTSAKNSGDSYPI